MTTATKEKTQTDKVNCETPEERARKIIEECSTRYDFSFDLKDADNILDYLDEQEGRGIKRITPQTPTEILYQGGAGFIAVQTSKGYVIVRGINGEVVEGLQKILNRRLTI